jgi:hypothetical protein
MSKVRQAALGKAQISGQGNPTSSFIVRDRDKSVNIRFGFDQP